MRAVVYDGYGLTPTVREVPPPRCPDDGAVIAVRATGVCRSDWHAWRGHDPVPLPHIPGHEFAGVITQVGPLVREFTVGQRVTTPFVSGCGVCELCLAGDANVCPDQTQPGFTGPGSFAEQVVVPGADVNLVALPDVVDLVTAAALGCRFATAFRAVAVHGATGPGRWVVVFGCGGVGLSAVMVAVALGARVIAVDTRSDALARAVELGAEQTLGAEPDLVARIREITGGGAHSTIDAIGSPTVVADAVRSLRPRGRHVQVGLLLGDNASPSIPMDVVIARELSLHGSHGMSARDYPALLDLVVDGTLTPRLLVGDIIDLDRAGDALAAMDGNPAVGITVVALP